jgi:hypothetical protein
MATDEMSPKMTLVGAAVVTGMTVGLRVVGTGVKGTIGAGVRGMMGTGATVGGAVMGAPVGGVVDTAEGPGVTGTGVI